MNFFQYVIEMPDIHVAAILAWKLVHIYNTVFCCKVFILIQQLPWLNWVSWCMGKLSIVRILLTVLTINIRNKASVYKLTWLCSFHFGFVCYAIHWTVRTHPKILCLELFSPSGLPLWMILSVNTTLEPFFEPYFKLSLNSSTWLSVSTLNASCPLFLNLDLPCLCSAL